MLHVHTMGKAPKVVEGLMITYFVYNFSKSYLSGLQHLLYFISLIFSMHFPNKTVATIDFLYEASAITVLKIIY